ncbi:MAG: LamG-like jellyroll fold domain-containing protein [Planctomycetota bacterium]
MCRKLVYLISFLLVLWLGMSPSRAYGQEGLIGYWKFDETSGTTAVDSAGGDNNGTLSGDVHWETGSGRGGGVLLFGGTDTAHVEVPTTGMSASAGTVAMWAYLSQSQPSQTQYFFGHTTQPSYNNRIQLYMDGGTRDLDLGLGGSHTVQTGIMTLETATWYHIALTWDNGSYVVYIDGEVVASGAYTGLSAIHDFAWIGNDGNPETEGTEAFGGLLDEVQIYDRALSEDEIKAIMEGSGGFPLAMAPSPEDGALLTEFMTEKLATTLTWTPGDFADTHDVYFGDDFNAVNEGTGDTFQGNQADTYLLVGYGYMPNDPLPGGFVPGTTYYWRIDEVNDTEPNSPWKGDVWSFSLPPTKAHEPSPIDGSTFQDPNVDLSWELGFGGALQTVYFGEDYDAVNSGTIEGVQVGSAAYDPGTLEYDTTYYWRVETFGVYGQIKGDVWSFKTGLPGLGTIVLERWNDFTGTVPDLRNFYKYPNNPDEVETLNQFSWDLDIDNYGARIYGWVYAPATGDYTFWLCTDDTGELWLSTDDDSSNVELIAQESTWQNPNSWGTGEEQSEPIPLVAGNRYYIEALWQEGTSGDHCMVAWQGPTVPTTTIISGNYLSPYRPLKAFGARPTNRASGVTQTPVLQWKPGIQAASHEVYFGTNEDAVRNATKDSLEYIGPRTLGNESFDPGKLAWESTYYWRVDEVNNTNPDSPWVGSLWSFTTADYAIVDDFEDYNATDKQIWAIWHDGIGYWDLDGIFHPGNGTGSGVGDEDNDATYMEESIVHGSGMSMPYFFNNNDPAKMKYSEAKKTLVKTRDWTEEGVKALSLWFQGYLASVGSFTDNLDGTYRMTASGFDIWTNAEGEELDEFHFAYKPLTGAGSIIARVDSVEKTNEWAKAGVMIRDTLDPNSAHAMMVVTPSQGVAYQNRPSTGATSVSNQVTGITAPQWVKIERDLGGIFTASYSDDGQNWTIVGEPEPLTMGPNAFIGLALTAHDASLTCQAEFSNVQVSVSGPWANQDIGIQSNDPELIYVAVANSNGATGTVYYENNDNIVDDATRINTWTEFNINLKDFQDQGVNLADVNSIAIGFGTRGSTTNGGEGKVYIDDIRLYRPRCVPDKLTLSEADFDSNCVVDFRDLETIVGDWLSSEPDLAADLNSDSTVNFNDYAVFADQWLDEQLWPEW